MWIMNLERRWLRRIAMVLVSPHILYFYAKHAVINMVNDWKGAWNA